MNYLKLLLLLLLGGLGWAQTVEVKARNGNCVQAIADFLSSTPETDWMHRKIKENPPKVRDDQPYMAMLRTFGLKQAAGEVNLIWNKGYIDVQVSEIQFSDSYRLIRGSTKSAQNLLPSQEHNIREYFQHILAANARTTLAKPIASAVKEYHLKEPVILFVPDYAVFDNGCIPDSSPDRIDIEHISELSGFEKQKPVRMPSRAAAK
jgi:hypothetical protein